MKELIELRSLTPEKLKEELHLQRRKQFNLRMKQANGTLKNTHSVAKVRKRVARVKTIMTERAENSHV